MKKAIIFCFLIIVSNNIWSQVGIGTTLPFSQLEIKSSNQATPANTDGLIIPKIDNFPIINPTADQQGMMVYLTTTIGTNFTGFYYWDNSITSWRPITNPVNDRWSIVGNAGTNTTNNFIGTIDANDLIFKVNNTKAGFISKFDSGSTFFGKKAGLNDLGFSNSGFGANVMQYNTTGSYNTAMGIEALQNNLTGSFNTAFGLYSLSQAKSEHNTAVGVNSIAYTTTGSYNCALGSNALTGNNTGSYSTAVGYYALYANNADNSTAVGHLALRNNTTGSNNTALGAESLTINQTNQSNTAVGRRSLYLNRGNCNTAVGHLSLSSTNVGNNNTVIGYNTNPSNTSIENYSGFGFNVGSSTSNSNMVEIGNSSVSVIRGQVNFSTYSDRRIKKNIQTNVPGLTFINLLKPVTYTLDIHNQNKIIYKNKIDGNQEWNSKYDLEKIVQTGFIAQDVEAVAKSINFDFNGVQAPKSDDDLYALSYSEFVVPLVKAVQEQQAMILDLKADNLQLQQKIKVLIERLNNIEQIHTNK